MEIAALTRMDEWGGATVSGQDINTSLIQAEQQSILRFTSKGKSGNH